MAYEDILNVNAVFSPSFGHSSSVIPYVMGVLITWLFKKLSRAEE